METNIKLTGVDVTYRIHLDKTATFKEWIVDLATGKRWKTENTKKVEALKGLNLEILHGERLGVIGLNGAGKSTLLKLISGLISPSAGTFSKQGNIQPLIELGAGFNEEFTGRENIYFNGAMLGFSKKEILAFEDEIIDFSELRDSIDMPVKYYSSGMTTRLAFSIATSIRPEILVLDEMLGAGDITFVEKAEARMKTLIDDAKMLVIVSHALNMIESLCTRTIVLDRGRLMFDGAPQEAIEYYKNVVAPARKTGH